MIKIAKTINCRPAGVDCQEEALLLSHFDEFVKEKKGVDHFIRHSKYRCRLGHLSIMKSNVTSEDLKPDETELPKQRGTKHFTKKGCADHKGQTPRIADPDNPLPRWLLGLAREWKRPIPMITDATGNQYYADPAKTNHDRMLERAEQRRDR